MCKQFGIAVIRAVIILANLLLFIASLALMFRTGKLYLMYKSYEEMVDPSMQIQPLVSFVLSILVFMFSLFGFFAIWMNALGMTVFFIAFMCILGLSNVAFGTIMLLESADMYTDSKYFENLLDQAPNASGDVDKLHAIENIQRDLLCCGMSYAGPYEYINNSLPLPQSCCKDPYHPCVLDDIWNNDCLFELEVFGVRAHTEIAAMLMTSAVQCLMTAGIGYVFAMAIRQYYYY